MAYILWPAIVLLTIIIQARVSLFDVQPSFTSALAYYAGIRKGELRGIFFGSLIGTIEDSLSATFLGPNLLSKGLVGYFSSFIYSGFFRWTPFLGIIAILFLTAMDSTVVFVLRSIFDKTPVDIKVAVFVVTIQSIINAPLGIFLKPRNVY